MTDFLRESEDQENRMKEFWVSLGGVGGGGCPRTHFKPFDVDICIAVFNKL